MPDCYRGLVPLEPAVDVAVRAVDARIVGHAGCYVLPIAALGDAPVPLDYVVGVARRDVVEHQTPRRAHSHHREEGIRSQLSRARFDVPMLRCLISVAYPRQVADGVTHRHVGPRTAGSMRRRWKWTPLTKIVAAVPEIRAKANEEEAAPILRHAVPHRVEELWEDLVACRRDLPREMLDDAEGVSASRRP